MYTPVPGFQGAQEPALGSLASTPSHSPLVASARCVAGHPDRWPRFASGAPELTWDQAKIPTQANRLGWGTFYRHQARSKRSRFITLFHAATKSFTNFCLESAQA